MILVVYSAGSNSVVLTRSHTIRNRSEVDLHDYQDFWMHLKLVPPVKYVIHRIINLLLFLFEHIAILYWIYFNCQILIESDTTLYRNVGAKIRRIALISLWSAANWKAFWVATPNIWIWTELSMGHLPNIPKHPTNLLPPLTKWSLHPWWTLFDPRLWTHLMTSCFVMLEQGSRKSGRAVKHCYTRIAGMHVP